MNSEFSTQRIEGLLNFETMKNICKRSIHKLMPRQEIEFDSSFD